MDVYRITKTRYADSLIASGGAARWSDRGRFVIYTASSRALACLENIVHRSGEGLQDDFRVMLIHVPDQLSIEIISLGQLPTHWSAPESYPICQALGHDWLSRAASAVLRVPSAIIPNESNYLLNPQHPDFGQIHLLGHESFLFDSRLKV